MTIGLVVVADYHGDFNIVFNRYHNYISLDSNSITETKINF